MTLDMDITDKKSRELLQLLRLYPSGHLEVKHERIFWCSDYSEPEESVRDDRRMPEARSQAPPGNRYAQGFKRAGDALGSMMGPPPPSRGPPRRI